MAKKDQDVLAEAIDMDTYKTETVIGSPDLYVVCYQDKPIQLQSGHYLTDEQTRYKKTVFANKTHAISLARRLNTKFKTDRFTVRQIGVGVQVYPQEQTGVDSTTV